MKTYRSNAVFVGLFYIVGTLSGILSMVVTPSGADSTADQLRTGALLILTMGGALAAIPVLMYPILKQAAPTLGIGYIVFRGGLETVGYGAAAVAWLVLAVANAGGLPEIPDPVRTVLYKAEVSGAASTLAFCAGAAIFYTALFKTRLVPRWLAVWGLIAIVPYCAAGMLTLFGVVDTQSAPAMAMYLPLAIQEMVLAVWLIAKGFTQKSSAHHTEASSST